MGDYADLVALRSGTREGIIRQRTADAEEEFNGKAVEALVEGATFAYPAAAVENTIHEMLGDLEARVSQIGYSLQDFLRLQGMTVEGYHEELRPAAERRLKDRLALSELADVEAITVTPEESQAEVDRLVRAAADDDKAKGLRETLGSESGQWLITRDLRTRKALARLREIAAGLAIAPTEAGEMDSPGVSGAESGAASGAEAPAAEAAVEEVVPGPAELPEAAGNK
jgi:trigger factor